jgi:hypothetical protein
VNGDSFSSINYVLYLLKKFPTHTIFHFEMLRTEEASKINGLQYPPNIKQSVIFICYIIVSASYFFFVGAFMIGLRQYVLLIVDGTLASAALICWFWTIQTNPGLLGNEIKLHKPPVTRYCSQCNKHVYGMDHHCVWLNNCIGTKNYTSFYVMLWLGSIQMILQTVVGVLYQTGWFKRVEDRIDR